MIYNVPLTSEADSCTLLCVVSRNIIVKAKDCNLQ